MCFTVCCVCITVVELKGPKKYCICIIASSYDLLILNCFIIFVDICTIVIL